MCDYMNVHVCCNLDLELALNATDVDSSSFLAWSYRIVHCSKMRLIEAQQAQEYFSKWQHMCIGWWCTEKSMSYEPPETSCNISRQLLVRMSIVVEEYNDFYSP